MIEHPYIKYAIALIMEKRNYQSCDEITTRDIVDELAYCRNKLGIMLKDTIKNVGNISFKSCDKEPNCVKTKVESDMDVLVAPYVIIDTSEKKNLKNAYDYTIDIINKLNEGKENNKETITKTIFPIGGEYFYPLAKTTKTNAKLTVSEYALIAITTLTEMKPCSSLLVKKDNGKGQYLANTCLIPDLSISATKDFISVFRRRLVQTTKDLFIGNVRKEGEKMYASLPQIFRGNFDKSSKSPYLKALTVLGYIGELVKDKEFSLKAQNVISELEMSPILLIKPIPPLKSADIIKFSHYIIQVAQNGSLNRIINSLYYARFYKYKGLKRTDDGNTYKKHQIDDKEKSIDYEKYDYFTSKFLTLFNHFTFNEFLSCRVEYPLEIETLLTIYFTNMEQISIDIINSAEAFGAWINRCSFIAAMRESFSDKKYTDLNDNERLKVTEKKYKFLVELESSVFSSDNNRSMISNIITRVGRLSNTDVPQEAALFIKAVVEPSIDISTAKNLVIAFSRIYSKGDDNKPSSNNSEAPIGEIIDSSNI
ncbi:MAG: hypothetical protein IJR02_13215 [Bacteroidaceae bacterium]|nr:hypothetical protein [Bacteroidaceae bacterium]